MIERFFSYQRMTGTNNNLNNGYNETNDITYFSDSLSISRLGCKSADADIPAR
jgi:hypothetical protein